MPLNKEAVFAQAREGKLWAGHLIPGHAGPDARLENITPIDGSVIGHIADGSSADIDAAVKAPRTCSASGEWARRSRAERKQAMYDWIALMREHAEELAALDCVDAGKPITECLNTDMPATLDTFAWYAEAIDKCFGKIAPTGPDALG